MPRVESVVPLAIQPQENDPATIWYDDFNGADKPYGEASGIRRFIDSKAHFTFIPEGETPPPKAGEAFDIPGVRLTHRKGHSSFHTFLDEYTLSDPVLRRIARIIDEADTVQAVSVEPVAAGLDLICRGIRRTSPGDEVALERGAVIYEALYADLAAQDVEPNTKN